MKILEWFEYMRWRRRKNRDLEEEPTECGPFRDPLEQKRFQDKHEQRIADARNMGGL